MLISEMRETITLQTNTRTDQTNGDFTYTPSTYATVKAAIQYKTATEQQTAGQKKGVVTLMVTMRYQSAVNETYSVLWNSRTYKVIGVTHDQKRRFTTLEVVREG